MVQKRSNQGLIPRALTEAFGIAGLRELHVLEGLFLSEVTLG